VIRFTAWLTFYFIFLIQIIGNGITIYLLLCTNIRGKTNIFVGSLAICDLVSGINSPVGAYREVPGRIEFEWPRFVNDLYVFVEFYTSFVANFHVAVFATFRYLSICRRIQITHKQVISIIITLWVVPLIYLVSDTVINTILCINDDEILKACDCTPPIYSNLKYMIADRCPVKFKIVPFVMFLTIPLVLLIVSSCAMIIHILNNYSQMRNKIAGGAKPTYSRQQMRAMLIILAIVGCFLIGELPLPQLLLAVDWC